MNETEQTLVSIAAKTAAEAAAKAAADIAAQNATMQERILGEIKVLTKTCERMEGALIRGGERMEKLEIGNALCDKHSAVTDTRLMSIDSDILDLKGTRRTVSWAIVGSYVSGIAGKFWK